MMTPDSTSERTTEMAKDVSLILQSLLEKVRKRG